MRRSDNLLSIGANKSFGVIGNRGTIEYRSGIRFQYVQLYFITQSFTRNKTLMIP